MKKTVGSLMAVVVLALLPLLVSGCGQSAQQTAYRTVGTVGVTVDAAMETWAAWCKSGKATADQVATVEKAYRAYVAAYNIVVDAGKATVGTQDSSTLLTAVKVMSACESDVVTLVLQFLPADLSAKLKGS